MTNNTSSNKNESATSLLDVTPVEEDNPVSLTQNFEEREKTAVESTTNKDQVVMEHKWNESIKSDAVSGSESDDNLICMQKITSDEKNKKISRDYLVHINIENSTKQKDENSASTSQQEEGIQAPTSVTPNPQSDLNPLKNDILFSKNSINNFPLGESNITTPASEKILDTVNSSGGNTTVHSASIGKYFRDKFRSLTFRSNKNRFFSSVNVSNNDETSFQGTYKKTSAHAIVAAIQLGIVYSVGKQSAKPDRDILLADFFEVEQVNFPSAGSTITPSHKFADFTMCEYSPVAFRYFRDIFSISPLDFMTTISLCPLQQLSNPGASGSMFFVTEDDRFIIKTVDRREAKFLQQLLPGYYMNQHQNPQTLLPKFFGLYSYKYSSQNIRLVVMNNLLPSKLEFHEKFDLKGSTHKRKASQKEREKTLPTLKDLDFIELHPKGFQLTFDNCVHLLNTLQRDVRMLESYKIMDYSLLLCVHNKTLFSQNKGLEDTTKKNDELPTSHQTHENGSQHTHSDADDKKNAFDIDQLLKNGTPAKNDNGDDLIIFFGIIDILQNYRLFKRTEHNFKSLLHDKDSISVHNPKFYAKRFLNFCSHVFQVQGLNVTFDKTPINLSKKRVIDISLPKKKKINSETRNTSVTTSFNDELKPLHPSKNEINNKGNE